MRPRLPLQKAVFPQQYQPIFMVIVLRKIKVCAAALRTIYNAPHRLFIAAVRFGIVLLRYTLQHVPHLRRASGPAVCRKGIVPLTRLRRANAPLFAVGKI